MKLMNRDLTKESVVVYVTGNQIYIEVFAKIHGKWVKETFFQSFDWEIDQEYVNGTVRYIKRTWGLKDPQVVVVVK